MSKPLLSVCLITYNQAKYIREAIDGVLMQKVNFTWKLIIADDFSTDGTREIILEYKKKYPQLIKLILQGKNVGAAINFKDLMTAPSSKYIAYIEGDDYWNNPDKLQRQVDLLESNSEIAGCFSNAIIVDDNGQVVSDDYFSYHKMQVKTEIRTEDIVPFGISPSNSLLFRRDVLINPPDWFVRNSRHSAIDLLITLHGTLVCINEKLGAYRVHSGGTWSLTTLSSRLMSDLLFLKPMFKDDYLRKNYGPKIRAVIRGSIVGLWEARAVEKSHYPLNSFMEFLFAYPIMPSYFLLVPYWIIYQSLFRQLEKTEHLYRIAKQIKGWMLKINH